MPTSPLARQVLSRLDETFRAAADPNQAQRMRAYMRDQFRFLGLPAPRQRTLAKALLEGLPKPTQADLEAVAAGCWRRDEREFQYFACDLLRRHVAVADASLIEPVKVLITTKSWWDTVDTLASRVVGRLVATYPELVSTMDAWVVSDNLWIARTAILHQLTYKQATDTDRLFRYCTAQAGHRDFFIRKAIGWALRQYAWTDPDAVRTYVATHDLAPLSRREALKNL